MSNDFFLRSVSAALVAAALALWATAAPAPAGGPAAEQAAGGKRYSMRIEGMSCGAQCPPKVANALRSIDGVASVEVRYEDRSATVTMLPGHALTARDCDHSFANQGYFVSDFDEAVVDARR